MKIKYLGPRHVLTVAGYGIHLINQVKDYPADVAKDLLASERQQFEPAETAAEPKAPKGKEGKKSGE